MLKSNINIGVLGLGSLSTLFYLETLNKVYNRNFGDFSTCPLLLLNTNFNEINPFLPDQYKSLETNLLPYLKKMEELNISHLLIPNITLHKTWELLNKKQSFKYTISHPIELTIQSLKRNKQTNVILFASFFNMSSNYFKSYFLNENIEVITLSQDNMQFIDHTRKQVYLGIATIIELEKFNTLVNSYANDVAVILACTELSIAYKGAHQNVYDMAHHQINDTIKKLITP